ncbi:hypothetical protein Pst134EA_007242 [Puccinia striiformis f. sp. tritici]|uniref:hypothetical protein n=1 Tax=Puccinia striiformis f. sp. tritici TaxID=168172 RepID=UPI0020084097|nr:hypothetical protein Pst134EA_007242 [Puccinia striiformis f. sp. tritici]KAH9469972.1 hypothetical protein Pst134EA_007242 [Puccinia striiformis f. sp. tritici]
MKFHKRVPSFSFSTFSFNSTNEQQQQQHSPTTPSTATTTTTTELAEPQQQQQQQQQQLATLLLSPDDPLRFILQSTVRGRDSIRKRAGSLTETSNSNQQQQQQGTSRSSSTHNNSRSRRSSIGESAAARSSTVNSNASNFNRHRKRLSNLFSPLANHSRSPSPGTPTTRKRSTNTIDQSPEPEDPPLDLTLSPSESSDSSDSSASSDEEEDEEDLSTNEDHETTNQEEDEDEEEELLLSENDTEAQTILANTHANASSITPIDYLQKSNQPIPFIDQAPNITSPPPIPISFASTDPRSLIIRSPSTIVRKTSISSRNGSLRRRTSSSIIPPSKLKQQHLKLNVSRPIYQKNRCTITIEHGDFAKFSQDSERNRFYLVACDLSDESKYAIEWTIGTVLRQGDECLIIMIIETDSKLDPEEGSGTAADRTAKIRNQKDRQEKATLLVREATALLERTGLNVKVTCQAIHGKNPKHMLIDCIDYLEPNLVIVGRRGLTSSKTSLMGSVSHYLVQKSSVPVMVARRRLRTLPKVYKKKFGVVPSTSTLPPPLPSQQEDSTQLEGKSLIEEEEQKPVPTPMLDPSSSPTISISTDLKRLSIVSEETDKTQTNLPKPDQGNDLKQDGEDNDHREPASSLLPKQDQLTDLGLSGQVPGDGEGGDPGVQTKAELIDKDPTLVSFAK